VPLTLGTFRASVTASMSLCRTRHYVRFDVNLASDFLNTNPDGTLIDRSAFIA
jgi:hypothetical protein